MKRILQVALLPALVASIFLACNSHSEKEQTPGHSQQHMVKSAFINGDSLHFVEAGQGETIILIHGTLGDYREWLPHLDTFSKNYRVITYSRRYAYPNRQVINDSADYSVIPHAEDLAAFIRSLATGPVHLVGHSYGAFTALLTTIRYPELVKSCVLGEPPAVPLLMKVPGGDTIAAKFFAVAKPAAEAFRSGNDEKAISLFAGWVFGDTTVYQSFSPEMRSAILANSLELRGAILSTNPFPDITCDDIGKIKTPVLLMQGDRTIPFFSVINQEIDKCLANNETVVLQGASHGLQMENPGDFNRIVLQFIDKH